MFNHLCPFSGYLSLVNCLTNDSDKIKSIVWGLFKHSFFLPGNRKKMNYLNDSNYCFSCCDKNFSISKIRQSALHEQTNLHWLNKVSLLSRTKKLLLRELKSLTASNCLIISRFLNNFNFLQCGPLIPSNITVPM